MTGEAWLVLACLAIDLAVVIALAVSWPPSLLVFAALVIVVVALIGEGAERMFGGRGGRP